ncbi:GNAT family N-acetyltransferase [Prolixibacteraceae bacterium Z1-6]|uniref:GNAT family N-acetyltransferase n=1 Tax=Draconibacterium aestuarii TaxID=2998507 RepID=A0A9X3J5D2_9BACT|nr:GNAT family N-acetyltransferase [Prolixibacteraceae bacterium Z1-6]
MITIRAAVEQDSKAIMEGILGMAEHVKQTEMVTATEQDIKDSVFKPGSHVEVFLAETENKQVCGYTLIFKTFSTFKATTNYYIEDLFVFPEYRGKGIGLKLLNFVKNHARNQGADMVEWYVNNANTGALDFYNSLGAKVLDYKSIYYMELDK